MDMKRQVRQRLLAGAAVSALVFRAEPAAALECPEPQTAASAGVLEEPEAEINEMSRLLASGDTENRVAEILADLRRRYPHADSAELVNFLVTAYCPVVNDEAIGDDAKRTRLEAFSSLVYKMLSR